MAAKQTLVLAFCLQTVRRFPGCMPSVKRRVLAEEACTVTGHSRVRSSVVVCSRGGSPVDLCPDYLVQRNQGSDTCLRSRDEFGRFWPARSEIGVFVFEVLCLASPDVILRFSEAESWE